MPDDEGATNVAIACQGGGSHTAFTAGVLQTLLAGCDWGGDHVLVGISGTSGGAFNALATWYGLVVGGEERAIDLLDAIWEDLGSTGTADRLLNEWLIAANRMEAAGFPLPRISPYDVPGPEVGKRRIRTVLERHIEFDAIPDHCRPDSPDLVVGTVNVNDGVFETFANEAVTVEAILASSAVPYLFEAVEIDGHYHWDGQFSQNPPVSELMAQPGHRKPDELWVIQINPQRFEGEPTTLDVIADRRNELAGNISLNQELRFIEQVNEWVDEGKLVEEEFVKTEVRRIQMDGQFSYSTKLDRDPAFIAELQELGRTRAGEFMEDGS